MAAKLILNLSDTQATAARIAEAVSELETAFKDHPADIEVHGTLYPNEGQHVVPDSDLTLLCDTFGVRRQQGETAHQVIHRIVGMRKRAG